MLLDEECKECLYNSQMKKVERERGSDAGFSEFKNAVKALCENPPATYCAPLLMRDIDGLHRKIFGKGIDYSREKHMFNQGLLKLEEEIFSSVMTQSDPIEGALKLTMCANYIDFARIADLDESAIGLVLSASVQAKPAPEVYSLFKTRLKTAKTLLYLHDNCGEIVLDKVLIRVINAFFPNISVISVVRGGEIINDATLRDAHETGLDEIAEVTDNGSNAPGTYLKEVSPNVLRLLKESDIVISKGLGNLETLYGEGYDIFYSFTCKCGHIAKRFNAELMSAVFAHEGGV